MTTIIPFISPSRPPALSPLPRAALTPAICRLPLLQHRISAGFPSPADGYLEEMLDLNSYLVRNKTATFFFRVKGDSMIGANIINNPV